MKSETHREGVGGRQLSELRRDANQPEAVFKTVASKPFVSDHQHDSGEIHSPQAEMPSWALQLI